VIKVFLAIVLIFTAAQAEAQVGQVGGPGWGRAATVVTPSVVAANAMTDTCGGPPVYTTCAYTATGLVAGTTAYFFTYAYTGDSSSPGTYIPVTGVSGTGLTGCALVTGANSYSGESGDDSTDDTIACTVTAGGSINVTATWSSGIDSAAIGVIDISPSLTDSGFGNGISNQNSASPISVSTNGSLTSGTVYSVVSFCYGNTAVASSGTPEIANTTIGWAAQWRNVTGAGAADTETMTQTGTANWNCQVAAAHP
jgi:hypothetical protein